MSISLKLLQENCVAWYDFDRDTKTVVSRYGSSMSRGKIYGDLTRGTGWLGRGGSLKGTGSSAYDRVEFDDKVIPSGDFTIRFKIKLDSDPLREICVLSTRPNNSVATGIHISVAPNGLVYFYGNMGNNITWNISRTLYTKEEIAQRKFTWKDVVVTKNSSTNQVTLSVNGIGRAIGVGAQGNITHSANLRLMSTNNTSNSQLKGEIDGLIILNKSYLAESSGHSMRRVAVKNESNGVLYELNYNKNVLQNFNTNMDALFSFGEEFPEIAFATDATILNLNYKYDSYEEYADKVDTALIEGINLVRYKIPPVDYYELVGHSILDKVLYYINGETYWISNSNFVKLKDGLPSAQDFTSKGTGANSPIELDQLYGNDKPWIELLVSVVDNTLPTSGSYYKAKASFLGNNDINNKPQFSILDKLGQDVYSVVMYTEKEEHSPKIIVDSGNILGQIVEPIDSISIVSGDIDNFHVFAKSIGDTRYAVSFSGANGDWFTFSDGDWKSIGNASLGEDVSTLENISSAKWNEKLVGVSEVRFSYYITMTSELDSVNVVVSNRDKDDYANTDSYTMDYDKDNKKINFNISKSGRYKVSYYDKE